MTTHAKTVTNGVNMEALGKTVSAIQENPNLAKSKFRISNKWLSGGVNQTCVQNFQSLGQENAHQQNFELHADEPLSFGGTDQGANPVEHLLNSLAACVTTSIVAHAAVRGIPIEEIESQVEGDLDIRGFLGLDPSVPKEYQDIRITFKIKVAPEDIDKLKELAEFSPVYDTLTQGQMSISRSGPSNTRQHHDDRKPAFSKLESSCKYYWKLVKKSYVENGEAESFVFMYGKFLPEPDG